MTAGRERFSLRRVLVATARILPVLREAGVTLDALVGSLRDPSERYRHGDLDPPPKRVVLTDGDKGGEIWERDRPARRFLPAPAISVSC